MPGKIYAGEIHIDDGDIALRLGNDQFCLVERCG
jgi:hypothetical protein